MAGDAACGGIGRIWADGSAFDVPGAIWRLHRGTETQMPDPFIEATMGAGLAPGGPWNRTEPG